MMKINQISIACLFILFMLIWSSKIYAQASIVAENTLDLISFIYKDALGITQTEEVTLIRDAQNENQWYYVPSKPSLTTSNMKGQVVPEFSLVKYDYIEPTSQIISRAGLLNFSIRLSLPPEAIEPLKSAAIAEIKKRLGTSAADNIRLGALPINSATVSVYQDNKLVGAAEGTGIAPTFASQQMSFSLPLTNVGVAVFDELINSATGIRTAIQYSYNGLTPAGGFSVKVDYKNAHKHYSENKEFRARASYYGLFGVTSSNSRKEIREELIQSGTLKIEEVISKDFTADKIDAYLQPILKRINDQILEYSKAPETISPATAAPPSAGGFFASGGYSVATQSFEKLKVLEEVISFKAQSIVERNTVAMGFIGIGNFPEEVKKQVYVTVDGTQFPSAYMAFPEVPQGIDRIDTSIALTAEGQQFSIKNYQFKRQSNWINLANNGSADRISFSLAGVEQALGKSKLSNSTLKITNVIRSSNDSVTSVFDVPITKAAMGIDIESNLSGLRLRPGKVSFKEYGGDIVRVEITAKTDNKQKNYTFEAVNQNGTWLAPKDEFFFLNAEKAGSDVIVQLKVVKIDKDNKQIIASQSFKINLGQGLTNVNLDEWTHN